MVTDEFTAEDIALLSKVKHVFARTLCETRVPIHFCTECENPLQLQRKYSFREPYTRALLSWLEDIHLARAREFEARRLYLA